MKSKYISALIIVTVIIFGAISCKKFVQIAPPKNQIVSSRVFSNSSSATAALTVIYTQMNDDNMSYNIAYTLGLSADELTNYSTDQFSMNAYTNSLTSDADAGIWHNAYKYIYEANAVLEGLEGSKVVENVKKQLQGEALFIRAFWYYYLANFYGAVPLVTSTDYGKNQLLSRQPVDAIYNQVIEDLLDAKRKLNTDYLDRTNVGATSDRVRPNRFCADALLARAYLHKKDYKNAEKEASIVIDSAGIYSIEPDMNNAFIVSSNETLWRLEPTTLPTNAPEGYHFILTAPPSVGEFANSTISEQLLQAYDANDNRRKNWIDSIIGDNGTVYHFPFKYKVLNDNNIIESSVVLRLAEQYLIRAEARANLDKNNDAVEDINTIRVRAGLDPYSFDTKENLLAEVLKQRQLELFTEWGHRWFDLKRTHTIDAVMNIVCPEKGTSWKTTAQLFPIPQTEISIDPNLTQNDNY